MHRIVRPLARLSTWAMVHMAPRPLLLLIMQVPLELQAWPMVLPTLREVFAARIDRLWQPLPGLRPLFPLVYVLMMAHRATMISLRASMLRLPDRT